MKKGLMAEPFYYIFAMIVIALIFFLGFKFINNLQETQEQAKFVDFKLQFQKFVDEIYYKNEGTTIVYSKSSSNKPLLIPRDVKEICFQENSLGSNIYAESKYFKEFSIKNLKPKENNLCIKVLQGTLSFTLENKVFNQETIIEIR